MNFLHLSTGDVRGAFTAAYRLHDNLRASGHVSKMFVVQKSSSDPDVLTPHFIARFSARIITKLTTQVFKRGLIKRNEWKRCFFPYWGIINPANLYKRISFKPDLIIVYYVADFLSAENLMEIQAHFKAPMAFYLMDGGMLTGGCHYPWDCKGYQEECGSCSIFRWPGLNSMSNRTWHERKSAFAETKYSIIAASEWLYRLIQSGSLHKGRRVDKILIGIDPCLFKPREKSVSRKTLGMETAAESIVIYFGAQQLDDPRKGFSYLLSALRKLQDRLDDNIINRIVLLTVGKHNANIIDELRFKHHHVNYLHDKEAFATTYNAADVFICPSIEDAGPMMINEAMMSGTPVIAFRMGVAEDLVIDAETGYLANNFDADDLADKLYKFICQDAAARAQMSENCRNRAELVTSYQAQAGRIVQLAKEMSLIV